jgi:dynein heavy chain, axonemal
MEAVSLGWDTMALSWLNKCNPIWSNEEYKPVIMATLRWIIPDCLNFIRKNCQQFLKPGDINIVMTTLSIFEMLLNDAIEENPDEYAKFITSWFQAAISFAVIWGLSGIMNTESRIKFDEFYREVGVFGNSVGKRLMRVFYFLSQCVDVQDTEMCRLYILHTYD